MNLLATTVSESALPAPAQAKPSLTGKRPLRLLTLNIHKGFSIFNRRFVLHELREAIRADGADLVCLQEVLGDHQGHARKQQRWPVGGQYEFLADQIWSQYAYGRNAAYPMGHHGNAVLSKFPIARHENHDVSIAGPERRGLLHCQLQLPQGGHLDVICVHLSLLESHRRKQLSLLCDLIQARIPAHSPLVVAGDFNDWRCNAHSLLLRGAGLVEAHVARTGRAPRTYPARWPILRLDRIYTRGFLQVTPTEMPSKPWSRLSDHRPLAVDLLW